MTDKSNEKEYDLQWLRTCLENLRTQGPGWGNDLFLFMKGKKISFDEIEPGLTAEAIHELIATARRRELSGAIAEAALAVSDALVAMEELLAEAERLGFDSTIILTSEGLFRMKALLAVAQTT